MAETVTLRMPEELLAQAKEIARRSGQPLEKILTEWIKWGVAREDITGLVSGAEYPIFTPYGNDAAAQVLLDALKAANNMNDSTEPEQ